MKTVKNILTIGDLHGRNCWKDFADIRFLLSANPDSAGFGAFIPEYDLYVFLADYVDSFTIQNMDIRENLLEVIRFKTLYPDNVILLWGNHDVEYWRKLPWVKENVTMTGFRPETHYDLYEIFNRNVRLFQLAFQYKNYLWTHAGVHAGWYNYVFKKEMKDVDISNMTIADQLNDAFLHRLPSIFLNDFRRGGTAKVGGPLWCSKELSSKKPLNGYHQIVGHSWTDEIKTFNINKSTSITFCDVLKDKSMFENIVNTPYILSI